MELPFHSDALRLQRLGREGVTLIERIADRVHPGQDFGTFREPISEINLVSLKSIEQHVQIDVVVHP
jgi:hypothetical protein